MTTGKTEIKVPPPAHVRFTKEGRAYADMDSLIDAELGRDANADAELARLERAVIDKVKSWSSAILKGTYAQIQADDELRDALEALETFEAKQKNEL